MYNTLERDMIKLNLREKQLSIHITSHCTLNCKLCAVLVPYGRELHLLKQISYAQIVKDIDACFSIYSYIEDITINGGEPLMHPNLPKIIAYCMRYVDQFHRLRIFSNGTIYPSASLISTLKEYSSTVELVIDHYGPNLSVKANEIIRNFETEHIPVRVNEYFGNSQHCGGWVDLGDPSTNRNISDEMLQRQFLNCHNAQYKCLTIYNGQLTNCGFAMFGYEYNLFPDACKYRSQDIIALSDETISLQEKQRRASTFGTLPLYACRFCNGFDINCSKRYTAAEQNCK